MSKKSAHPELKLFEYLNGNLDQHAAQTINAHLLECDECALVARLIRSLKETSSSNQHKTEDRSEELNIGPPVPTDHPDLNELASFFYETSSHPASTPVAAHVALCGHCREAIAQYARAEQLAVEYNRGNTAAGTVPPKAWEMIHEWEESSFAKLKPANEALGAELLTRLADILSKEQKQGVEDRASAVNRVPVLIVSSAGEFRSIEFFEKESDSAGASVLRHSEGSSRFDNKALLTLFGLGNEGSFVVSSPIRRDTIRLERVQNEEESIRTDYIIIED